jgi:hypothetical protein
VRPGVALLAADDQALDEERVAEPEDRTEVVVTANAIEHHGDRIACQRRKVRTPWL